MTAELAIMNKNGVALAADSAVTVGTSGGVKIFNTANKLFTLSKYHPIGIMVYGNSSFMGVPWETIIKIYREKLHTRSYQHLIDYADDFISFLSTQDILFPPAQQDLYFTNSVYIYFYANIRKEIDNEVKLIINQKGFIDDKTILQLLDDIIDRHYQKWEMKPFLTTFTEEVADEIIKSHSRRIERIKQQIFGGLPISKTSMHKLKKIAGWLFTKHSFRADNSGIVIAGFGSQEFFPALVSYQVECLVGNRLKYNLSSRHHISFDNTAKIVSFAQSEMVFTFMEGINPDYEELIITWLNKFFNELPNQIAEIIANDSIQRENLIKRLQDSSEKALSSFKKGLEKYKDENFVNKVITTVAALPKEELAAMAESLVNLTSLKRKVSTDSETVGGPVDVAVISKGDGFIWIKRKHYFKPECNPHFFTNYFRKRDEGGMYDDKT